MGYKLPTGYANDILGFLINIDEDDDKVEFVRIALKAQTRGAEQGAHPYNVEDTKILICGEKRHIWQENPDMIDDVKDERCKECRICGEVRRY